MKYSKSKYIKQAAAATHASRCKRVSARQHSFNVAPEERGKAAVMDCQADMESTTLGVQVNPQRKPFGKLTWPMADWHIPILQ